MIPDEIIAHISNYMDSINIRYLNKSIYKMVKQEENSFYWTNKIKTSF